MGILLYSYLNRWIQPDSIIPDGNPQSLNRYSYVLNNPVNGTDPTGHSVRCVICSTVATAIWNSYLANWVLFSEASSIVFSNAPVQDRVLPAAYLTVWGEAHLMAVAGAALLGCSAVVTCAETFGGTEEAVRQTSQAVSDSADAVQNVNSTFANSDKLMEHFEKHGTEFGYKTANEYLQGANKLIAGGDGIMTFQREGGDKLFYNPTTNEFAAESADGIIRTYFKPVDGLDYWLNQTEE